jgi:hypothetical protein
MTCRIRTVLFALALAAPFAPTAARADVATCGRCSSVGTHPSKSALIGAGLVTTIGVAGALLVGRRRR